MNKASKSIEVSVPTISKILKGEWNDIKDDMFRNIAAKIDYTDDPWQAVQTRDFGLLTQLLTDSQGSSSVYAVTGDAGTGKSFCLRQYVETHKNAYLLKCNEYWNRKYFLAELLKSMGRDYSGLTVAEMMMEVVDQLKKKDHPIIMMDEADKLSDQVLYFFITIYNELEDKCGLILCATDHLAKRIKRGLKLNKKGYKEIYSRIGRKFIELKGVGSTDVAQICMANGISDKQTMKEIFQDSEADLRRVKRKIHAVKMSNKNKAA